VSKKISQHFNIARRRGRALQQWKRRYKKKRQRDEVMAFQHRNQVLTRENERLKMTMDGLQRHWGNYQHMYPLSPPLQDYYT